MKKLTRAEFQTLYDAGPDAVFAVFDDLLTRVQALEDRLAKDSHNSHKPPSSDSPASPAPRKTQSLRRSSGRRPGGQRGHPGHSLRLSPTPDRIEVHRPSQCAGCGRALDDLPAIRTDRCQVLDLPPMTVQVVEHHAQTVCCPTCQQVSVGTFPLPVIQPVQYGPRLLALALYLRLVQVLPAARTTQVLQELFGTAPSPAPIETALQRCASAVEPVEAASVQGIQQAPVAHFDETSLRVAGTRQWLHVASTRHLTHYAWHPKRGRAATDASGILPHFQGIAVHDGWCAYATYPCAHALCTVHHLRELTFLEEQYQHAWARDLKTLLLTIKQQVAAVQTQGGTTLPVAQRTAFERQYAALLDAGDAANPPTDPVLSTRRRGRPKQSPARNLLERLRRHQPEVFRFMTDFQVPFDNSQAERDIRMVKLQQKISGCFRHADGATWFCRLRGILSTWHKQGQALLPALEHALCGQLMLPAVPD